MKLIIAYIQPHKLNDVKQELYTREVYKISVTNALGCGQQRGYHESYRGVDIEVNLLKKIRLEIAVNDNFVKPNCETLSNKIQHVMKYFKLLKPLSAIMSIMKINHR